MLIHHYQTQRVRLTRVDRPSIRHPCSNSIAVVAGVGGDGFYSSWDRGIVSEEESRDDFDFDDFDFLR